MKTLFTIITLLLTYSVTAQQKAIIPSQTQTLTWIGKAAVGGYAPEGTLGIQTGEISFTSEEITALILVVDMETLEQENKQLRDHLREEDFFYIEKYPVSTFVLSEKAQIINGKATLIGTMTIRGKTQTEEFQVSVAVSEENINLTINQVMDRTRYGVNHNSPSIFKRIKENAIADEFVLKGYLKFQPTD